MTVSRREFLKTGVAAGAGLVAGFPPRSPDTSALGPIAQTRWGAVRGALDGDLAVFHGIPYAAPPLGPLRFAAPAAPERWSGIRDAINPAPSAPQNPSRLQAVTGSVAFTQSEDCLTLTVWTPSLGGPPCPVLVWIHGGGFTSGGGDWPFYSGAMLARTGRIVVVNINYRLGALGYLYLPQLEATRVSAANRGLLDQMQALRWVRDNIAAFGGDPEQIAVAGQSAGAGSVLALLAVPASRALVRRALLQSPSVMPVARERALETSRRFLSAVGLGPGDAAKLRQMTVSDLLAGERAVEAQLAANGEWNPPIQLVLDGDLLPRAPLEVVGLGAASRVPLIVGTTRDEARAWAAPERKLRGASRDDLLADLRPYVGDSAATIYDDTAANHPGAAPWEVLSIALTTLAFRKPVSQLAQGHAANGGAVYLYRFDWVPTERSPLGACHCIELPFVFHNFRDWRDAPVLEGADPGSSEGLAAKVQRAWLSFVRTSDPNNADLPRWPSYTAASRRTLVFDTEVRTIEEPR